MTPDEATTAFASLSPNRQALVLADYAHALTVKARDTYIAGSDDVADPRRLREINEIQHRVTSQLLHLMNGNPNRYPDEVIFEIITGDRDAQLLSAFTASLRRRG